MIFDSSLEPLFQKKIPELLALKKLISSAQNAPVDARWFIEGNVELRGVDFPLVTLVLGSRDPSAPTLAVFAGVHGLERIGSDVVISWAEALVAMSHWDEEVAERLSRTRIVLMPIVNPTGVFAFQRANANGVDLMRNSPVRAVDPPWMLGGQEWSAKLPWFSKRIESEKEMETEAQAVLSVVEREISASRFAISVDVHSGFGAVDRLWFPWAKSKEPPPFLAQIQACKQLLDTSHPNHVYQVEPQAKSYTTHGDLWDWALEKHIQSKAPSGEERPYLPWTLELGSWLWVKKNPRQLFSSLGGFNPILPHRRKRILRRHSTLLDFFHRAVANCDRWGQLTADQKRIFAETAQGIWYRESA